MNNHPLYSFGIKNTAPAKAAASNTGKRGFIHSDKRSVTAIQKKQVEGMTNYAKIQTTVQRQPDLSDLPPEMIQHIGGFLHGRDRHNLKATSTLMRDNMDELSRIEAVIRERELDRQVNAVIGNQNVFNAIGNDDL
ncbi:MAG: hypothetical protein WDO19_15685 [Bacteroidota bacterium]